MFLNVSSDSPGGRDQTALFCFHHFSLPMTDRFLSLTEAEKHTGKSRSTLRRFVDSITKPDNHPDRELLQPSVEEVDELHANNHPFSWKVSVTLLDRQYPKEGSHDEPNATKSGETTSPELVGLLHETIAILKNDVEEKNKQIGQLLERQREQNFLLKQTAEQLTLLNSGTADAHDGPAVTVATESDEKGTDQTPSEPINDSPTATKESLWQKLNRKRSFFGR